MINKIVIFCRNLKHLILWYTLISINAWQFTWICCNSREAFKSGYFVNLSIFISFKSAIYDKMSYNRILSHNVILSMLKRYIQITLNDGIKYSNRKGFESFSHLIIQQISRYGAMIAAIPSSLWIVSTLLFKNIDWLSLIKLA